MQHCSERLNLFALSFLLPIPSLGILLNNTGVLSHKTSSYFFQHDSNMLLGKFEGNFYTLVYQPSFGRYLGNI